MEWTMAEWKHNYKELGQAHITSDNKIGEIFNSFYWDKKENFNYDGVVFARELNMTDGKYTWELSLKIQKVENNE
ncbi:hypothetical protein [Mycoplasma sp. B6400]|uniref:hypothetical protein n=1 Tax=Mycoplasma sp. B6400 TaxID=3401674 RepID=UPI003AACDA89